MLTVRSRYRRSDMVAVTFVLSRCGRRRRPVVVMP